MKLIVAMISALFATAALAQAPAAPVKKEEAKPAAPAPVKKEEAKPAAPAAAPAPAKPASAPAKKEEKKAEPAKK